ncbi:hypothetical protein [Tunturiibacter gelidiferens]|uniref:hypothetical protein n=1 Tax=Tunturiibacter gelidiferens TaxID=3069689 RepID=UPI003D9B845F
MGGGESDAAVAAGDESFFAFEFHVVFLLSCSLFLIADCLGWEQPLCVKYFKHDDCHAHSCLSMMCIMYKVK